MPQGLRGLLERFRRVVGRGVYPHQFAWLIDNALRRLLITPQALAGRVNAASDATVVELGPGSGYFSAELARRASNGLLVLVDIQPQMLEKARAKLKRLDVDNAVFAVCDANVPLPFRNGAADVIVLVSVLGEVRHSPSTCIDSAFHVLRPGGSLVVHESLPDPDRIRFDDLTGMLAASGFSPGRRWGPGYNYTATFIRP